MTIQTNLATRLRAGASSAALLAMIAAMPAVAQEPPLAAGLKAPRGLSVDGDTLIIAEQGGGRILAVGADGATTPIAEGIAAGEFTSPEGPTQAGVTAAVKAGDTYYFVVGGSAGTIAGTAGVYALAPGGAPVLVADLLLYETDNNTGGDVKPTGEPDIDSNPFDLVSDGSGGLFVTDAGANAVLHIADGGAITVFAHFADRENPLFGTLGGPTFDQVPTGLAIGPDGALYVTTLTGFPFVKGAARVYRMADGNGDGDALDEGETTTFAEGLTTATDLGFAADGTLYVTEFSVDMLNRAPGRLVKVADGAVTEVAAPLVSPTGLAVLADGRIAVTQEFPGVVVAIAP